MRSTRNVLTLIITAVIVCRSTPLIGSDKAETQPVTNAGVSTSAATYAVGGMSTGLVRSQLKVAEASQFELKASQPEVLGMNDSIGYRPTEADEAGELTYNLAVSPSVMRANDIHVKSREDIKIVFYIGPREQTATPKRLSSVHRGRTPSSESTLLFITASCQACAYRSIQQRAITYSISGKESIGAEFDFVFDRLMTVHGKSALFIDVDTAYGRNVDRLVREVVVDEGSTELNKSTSVVVLGEFDGNLPTPSSLAPDAIITISQGEQNSFNVIVTPINIELKRQLRGNYLDLTNQPKIFNKGAGQDFRVDVMRTLSGRTSLTLEAMFGQENKALQKIIAASGRELPTGDVDPALQVEAVNKQKTIDQMKLIGGLIYQRLFKDDQELYQVIKTIEKLQVQDRAVRVLIRTKGIAGVGIPWQLLHDPGEMGVDDLWGLRFEIIVDSVTRPFAGRIVAGDGLGIGASALFGAYKYGQDDFYVSYAAEQQAKHLREAMHLAQLLPDQSGTEFQGHLKSERTKLTYVTVFVHGSNGTLIVEQNGSPTVQDELAGARLLFAKDDPVSAYDLEALALGLVDKEAAFLERHPLVFLNACDTGTATISSTKRLTLPLAFLNLGAAGVIATEAPVFAPFALKFGNDLISQIAAGTEPAAALLKLRRSYLRDYGNPSGLLYTYYGIPVRGNLKPVN